LCLKGVLHSSARCGYVVAVVPSRFTIRFTLRAAHRFPVRQAVRDMTVHESFQVKTELIIPILFDGAAPEERSTPVSEIGEHRGLGLHAFQHLRDHCA